MEVSRRIPVDAYETMNQCCNEDNGRLFRHVASGTRDPTLKAFVQRFTGQYSSRRRTLI